MIRDAKKSKESNVERLLHTSDLEHCMESVVGCGQSNELGVAGTDQERPGTALVGKLSELGRDDAGVWTLDSRQVPLKVLDVVSDVERSPTSRRTVRLGCVCVGRAGRHLSLFCLMLLPALLPLPDSGQDYLAHVRSVSNSSASVWNCLLPFSPLFTRYNMPMLEHSCSANCFHMRS